MIRSYFAANAREPRASIAAPAAAAVRNWRRFNIVASLVCVAEMLGAWELSVNK
jgi:hypothetical protein